MSKRTINMPRIAMLASIMASGAATSAHAEGGAVSYQRMADALHAVLDADRTVYTKVVVNRLQNEEKVVEASEHWKDDKALPLPAQMFRLGSEIVAQKDAGFSYSLLSLWAINRQNAAKTAVEKEGLTAIAASPDKPFYKEEKLGKDTYFTAVYADRAVSRACIECHNGHRDSPRTDFKLGDVMGGVIIRIPMK